jgi:hypothetical protein
VVPLPAVPRAVPSEQALVVENRICQALRKTDPKAQVAHLGYTNTLPPPAKVRPAEGVFLEYAPINRRYDAPYEKQQEAGRPEGLHDLDANLKVFPKGRPRCWSTGWTSRASPAGSGRG